MKIVFSGGGTLGSVSPLLAVVENLRLRKELEVNFLWLGTHQGPEQNLVEKYNFDFRPIFSGKIRRYFSWRNFIDPILIFLGFLQSLFLLFKFKPDLILTAGGFVSVPVVWAGWFLRIPAWVHQQDLRPGLANKLMAPWARKITVTFNESLKFFPKNKTILTGNPVRLEILGGEKEKALEFFQLERGLLTILVFGGGTGALELNKIVKEAIPELVKFVQVIHLTGQDKMIDNGESYPRYHVYEFLTKEMPQAYAAADLVIARAGLATLTELAALGKPAFIIPLPNTHQEENATFFAKFNAIIKVSQKDLTSENLVNGIKELLEDESNLENLKRNISSIMPQGAADKMVDLIINFNRKSSIV